MNQLHTEREQRFIGLAAGLADDFAERAAQHDEDESFPFENYEQMRECGYTNLIIPEEFGGLGASLLTNASYFPPRVVCRAPVVVGYFVELLHPVT